MRRRTESKNIIAVRRLYEARGNPDIVKTVLAPDVRWEVVEGFPYSGIYQGLNGVFDFFTRLFADFGWKRIRHETRRDRTRSDDGIAEPVQP